MNRVRFLLNAKVESVKDGNISEILIPSGSYREATRVDEYDDGYCDIHLKDGSILYEIGMQFVEFHGIKTDKVVRPADVEEIVEKKMEKASPAPFLPPAKSVKIKFDDFK